MKGIKKLTNKIAPGLAIALLFIVWSLLSYSGIIPRFMLPSPLDVVRAFIEDFELLRHHAKVTLIEALLGLGIGIVLGFIVAVVMDQFKIVARAMYPMLVITQTVPTVAIAPLLVLWMGYGILPKIVLVVITTFFPITIGLLNGFASADPDAISLMKAMGANTFQRFIHIKLPSSLSSFFGALKISVSYSVVGAVISEWLGGFDGLGVYMTRLRKSYSFDKMFAVILFISLISLVLMFLVTLIQKLAMPWERKSNN
jgi:ABC-type nitrate/sulfonate/bicarbonate transport system permease component